MGPSRGGIPEALPRSGDQESQPGRRGVNRCTNRAAQAPAPTAPSANSRPGFPASPELTKLTAESGPATLPSPIVCKDKRDADSPTPRPGSRHWEKAADPGGPASHLSWETHPRASPRPGSHPGLVRERQRDSETSVPWPTDRPCNPCPFGRPPPGNQQIAGGLFPVATGIKWPASSFSYKTLSPEVGHAWQKDL